MYSFIYLFPGPFVPYLWKVPKNTPFDFILFYFFKIILNNCIAPLSTVIIIEYLPLWHQIIFMFYSVL